ncbi:Omega-6 fatty acid desaturase, endoplasmic reticulum [Wickerhamomyces ciferrii]|uniref:Omega-6 fatty acid desaturase, endoplasmic reticulum n=1 Tax=Wickerhamomyces ciferrii (strain ATCC 14091 / BCRC 22168 / CBS 111 / JCM 3599 / NBRC 0793 / NRRL Y-1031 F-60-10) TaxID=1206466 RepID=K0KKB4_WICCF|nr:Omega-6 fatty acid desaturase, endoplasmic reticulum [Wickerhamomyces ciferrii]CCH43391.1 Omega-6 fatty acid desaturase, endoplasmic reticulum [Wickerhamomyces ciferrii]
MSTTFTSDNNVKDHSTTTTNRKGNVATLSQTEKLTAIDTFGNTFEVPDYTIKDILKAIPAHCYERRVWESFYYVFRDIFWLGTFYYLANTFIPTIPNKLVRASLWAGYTIVQGLFGTGLWVLAHECGHQAFTDYGWVNDLTGWVLHSFLLVPYFSWKYSHGKHHKATGHLTRDTVFVPPTKDEFKAKHFVEKLEDLGEDSPIVTLIQLITQQLGGWLTYLTTNVTGQKYPDRSKWAVNHFNPTSPLFEKKDYWFIVLSDLGIMIQSLVLYKWYQTFGGFHITMNYVIPYLFVNHWLVFITYLQHTDAEMPHYDNDKWNFARGAAATIDRDFGFVGPFCFHDIIETHVLHHYVSRIPFYNAREASEAIKKVMGKHYRSNKENMFVALWKSARTCQFVDGDNGVRMFRNRNNIGVKARD